MRRFAKPIFYYSALTLLFFLLIAVLPANHLTQQQYSVSASQYHVLLFIVELPLAAIWFMAFFGYSKLAAYAHSIRETPEGEGFQRLARGSQWLAWGLPVPSIVSLILNAFANNHAGFHPTALIIANYLTLLFPLIAFTYMSNGSRLLTNKAKLRISVFGTKAILLTFVALGVLFCFLMFRKIDLQHPGSTNNSYYLPSWLIISTMIIPYLYAWFTGFLAAYEINLLAKNLSGVLYRQALRLLASGIALVSITLIAVQYIRSIFPRTGHLSVNSVLVGVYLLYLITIAGYVLISLGADRLKKFEEV